MEGSVPAVAVSSRFAVQLAVATLALGATLAAQARLPAAPTAAAGTALVPKPGTARIAALGFDSLLSDYYWMRAVQVVGDEHANVKADAPLIGKLVDAVVGLDPWVDHPYRFAALWISEVPGSVEAANRLLERGVAYHPLDWRDRFYLSFNHFYYRHDAESAARELEPAVGLEGAPVFIGRLLARLRAQGGDLEVAAAYLQTLARSAPDDFHRDEYESALDEIETERLARVLDQARAAYRERYGRDIERVEDLTSDRGRVAFALPPEPHGGQWVLGPGDAIVSSYYGHRYQINDQKVLSLGSPRPQKPRTGSDPAASSPQ